ncbi:MULTISPECIES: DUF6003 family protein [Streptomyces]|uniref:Uncharacterized protein n=1 Tax=Streptomyces nymphaeiformis TaxID=2663842 RepID=A0A7W7U861_9ACTN|nr:DUF6003 family protein [Streptomyces nymphaeiformis]MBB4986679.1 hypothetical protein [Streptomyces nymphaeiformis]
MADDAFLFLLHERHPRLGAALAAVGDLECSETPAVHGRLQAHGVSASSEEVRILPFDAAEFIPEGAEQLPIPLSPDETVRVEQACAPRSVPTWRPTEAASAEVWSTAVTNAGCTQR